MSPGRRDGCHVNVYVRSRPLLPQDDVGVSSLLFPDSNKVIVQEKKQDTIYSFDHVFPSNSSNAEVCDVVCPPLISNLFSGNNGSFIVYGQTGAGKTHTVLYTDGLISTTIDRIFNIIGSSGETAYRVFLSYLQIYQERIYDLLSEPQNGALTLREHPKEGIIIEGLCEEEVVTSIAAEKLIEVGQKKLIVTKTDASPFSSKSHGVCMIKVCKYITFPTLQLNSPTEELAGEIPTSPVECESGKLHICDLAGTERSTKLTGSRRHLRESRHINTSLLELGNVIHALASKSNPYIPFRNSILTRILKDSLGGNSKASLMVCISSSVADVKETKCSLNFGQRAMKVMKETIINSEPQIDSQWIATPFKRKKLRRTDYKILAKYLTSKLKELEVAYKMEKENLATLKRCTGRNNSDSIESLSSLSDTSTPLASRKSLGILPEEVFDSEEESGSLLSDLERSTDISEMDLLGNTDSKELRNSRVVTKLLKHFNLDDDTPESILKMIDLSLEINDNNDASLSTSANDLRSIETQTSYVNDFHDGKLQVTESSIETDHNYFEQVSITSRSSEMRLEEKVTEDLYTSIDKQIQTENLLTIANSSVDPSYHESSFKNASLQCDLLDFHQNTPSSLLFGENDNNSNGSPNCVEVNLTPIEDNVDDAVLNDSSLHSDKDTFQNLSDDHLELHPAHLQDNVVQAASALLTYNGTDGTELSSLSEVHVNPLQNKVDELVLNSSSLLHDNETAQTELLNLEVRLTPLENDLDESVSNASSSPSSNKTVEIQSDNLLEAHPAPLQDKIDGSMLISSHSLNDHETGQTESHSLPEDHLIPLQNEVNGSILSSLSLHSDNAIVQTELPNLIEVKLTHFQNEVDESVKNASSLPNGKKTSQTGSNNLLEVDLASAEDNLRDPALSGEEDDQQPRETILNTNCMGGNSEENVVLNSFEYDNHPNEQLNISQTDHVGLCMPCNEIKDDSNTNIFDQPAEDEDVSSNDIDVSFTGNMNSKAVNDEVIDIGLDRLCNAHSYDKETVRHAHFKTSNDDITSTPGKAILKTPSSNFDGVVKDNLSAPDRTGSSNNAFCKREVHVQTDESCISTKENILSPKSSNELERFINKFCYSDPISLECKEAKCIKSPDDYDELYQGYMVYLNDTDSYSEYSEVSEDSCVFSDSRTSSKSDQDSDGKLQAKLFMENVKEKYEILLHDFDLVMSERSRLQDEMVRRKSYNLIANFKSELDKELLKLDDSSQILNSPESDVFNNVFSVPDSKFSLPYHQQSVNVNQSNESLSLSRDKENATAYSHLCSSSQDAGNSGNISLSCSGSTTPSSRPCTPLERQNSSLSSATSISDQNNNDAKAKGYVIIETSDLIGLENGHNIPGKNTYGWNKYPKNTREKAESRRTVSLSYNAKDKKTTYNALEHAQLKRELMLTKLEKNRLEAVLSSVLLSSDNEICKEAPLKNLTVSRSTLSSSTSCGQLSAFRHTPSPFQSTACPGKSYQYKERLFVTPDPLAVGQRPQCKGRNVESPSHQKGSEMFERENSQDGSTISPCSSSFEISSMSDMDTPLATRRQPSLCGSNLSISDLSPDSDTEGIDDLLLQLQRKEKFSLSCVPFLKRRSLKKKLKKARMLSDSP